MRNMIIYSYNSVNNFRKLLNPECSKIDFPFSNRLKENFKDHGEKIKSRNYFL